MKLRVAHILGLSALCLLLAASPVHGASTAVQTAPLRLDGVLPVIELTARGAVLRLDGVLPIIPVVTQLKLDGVLPIIPTAELKLEGQLGRSR